MLVAHRRFGKTVGMVNHLIKMAILNKRPAPRYAYVAPFRNQAKQIAWSYLKHYAGVIPDVKINESELFIQLPTKHEGFEGAMIQIIGADHPDALRGGYYDGVILDEYAQIKSELWGEIIRPALADRKGWAVFIGTPKGQNAFYEMYLKAQREKSWYCGMYRADESGLFDEGGDYGPQELAEMKRDMTEEQVRQELYCDFTASAYNVLIKIDAVAESVKRAYHESDIKGAPVVLGVDVARFGDDRCVIFRRQGLVMFEPVVFQGIDNMSFAAQIMRMMDRYNPDAVFVDGGRGEGVIDRCRQMGYRVTEVNFGGKAEEPNRYINKRTEMWDRMRAWLDEGGSLPDVPALKTELVTPEYSFDTANRMKLEPKEQIKEKLGKSPDIADAAALTFAYNVRPRGTVLPSKCNVDYDPFA